MYEGLKCLERNTLSDCFFSNSSGEKEARALIICMDDTEVNYCHSNENRIKNVIVLLNNRCQMDEIVLRLTTLAMYT